MCTRLMNEAPYLSPPEARLVFPHAHPADRPSSGQSNPRFCQPNGAHRGDQNSLTMENGPAGGGGCRGRRARQRRGGGFSVGADSVVTSAAPFSRAASAAGGQLPCSESGVDLGELSPARGPAACSILREPRRCRTPAGAPTRLPPRVGGKSRHAMANAPPTVRGRAGEDTQTQMATVLSEPGENSRR